MTRTDIFAAIEEERNRQAGVWNRAHPWGWGDCSAKELSPAVKVMVLTEELGEVARAAMDLQPEQARKELVQLAACCVAWLEAL